MLITINGEDRKIDEGLTITALLLELKIRPQGTAVEVDREIIPRARHGQRVLREGEQVEIIRMVGGG